VDRSVPIAATGESSSAVQLVSGNFDSKWMVVLREVERESKELGEADRREWNYATERREVGG